MLQNKEIRQRTASEFRYAVTKMQEATQPASKLYYFSVFFGEAQRSLNWEWNTELTLIFWITQQVHIQVTNAMQMQGVLPIDWTTVFDKLTLVASDLATYFERAGNDNEEMYQILGRFSEIAYVVSGNGSYLHEKGVFKI